MDWQKTPEYGEHLEKIIFLSGITTLFLLSGFCMALYTSYN